MDRQELEKSLQSGRVFVVVLCALSAIPMLLPAMPPLTDVGGHLGRYAVMLSSHRDATLSQWYTFEWMLIPNLGVDLLVRGFGPLVGLERALRWIVIAIPVVHVAGTLVLSRVIHGHVTPLAVFAVPLAYGQVLHLGFLNYALSIGLALLGSAAWIALGQAGRTQLRSAVFVPAGLSLWVCHLSGWAVFCVIALCTSLRENRNQGQSWFRAASGSGLSLMPLSVGPILGGLFGPQAATPHISYGSPWLKIKWLGTVLWDNWMAWDVAGACVLFAVAISAWGSRHFLLDRGLALSGLVLACLFAVLPYEMSGTYYADMRLVPVVLTLVLVAACPKDADGGELSRVLMVAALVFTGSRLIGNAVSLNEWGAKFERTLAVLDKVELNAQLVTLFTYSCAGGVESPERRSHLGGFALARRHAFDNAQFGQAGAHPLRVHNPAAGTFERMEVNGASWEACGSKPNLRAKVGEIPATMDSLWIIGLDPGTSFDGWIAVAASEDSVVYRRELN